MQFWFTIEFLHYDELWGIVIDILNINSHFPCKNDKKN